MWSRDIFKLQGFIKSPALNFELWASWNIDGSLIGRRQLSWSWNYQKRRIWKIPVAEIISKSKLEITITKQWGGNNYLRYPSQWQRLSTVSNRRCLWQWKRGSRQIQKNILLSLKYVVHLQTHCRARHPPNTQSFLELLHMHSFNADWFVCITCQLVWVCISSFLPIQNVYLLRVFI